MPMAPTRSTRCSPTPSFDARRGRMNWYHLYLGFDGRIGRKAWWIGFLVLTAVELIGVYLFNPGTFEGPSAPSTLPELLWSLLLMVPGAALVVKRFNDRGFPWWWGYVFIGLNVLYNIAEFAGYFSDTADMTPAEQIAFWPFALVTLIVLVDNGFRRGTPGPNRYGPDPRAGDGRTA